MKNLAITLVITVLIFGSNFQAVSAEIFFPSTNIRLTSPPTYCILAPTEENLQEKSANWIELTKKGVSYWEEKLKEFQDNGNIWEMDTKVNFEQKNNECDIYIEFKNKPSLSETIGGFFSWPPGKIVIYYLQPKLCNPVIPCYDDKTFKSENTIYAITIHEIGHSLGLDHYVSDDNDLNKNWQSGNKSPPSVMIPIIPNSPSLLQISEIDVQKVREIYGEKGFYAFSDSIIPSKQIQVPKPDLIIPSSPITSLNISQKIIEIDEYGRQIITLSGKISEEEFYRGISVIITLHKPDNSIEVLRISTTGIGYFETLLIFNNESIRGSYHVSASYIEQVDKNMDIVFEVIDKKMDSTELKLKPNTQIFDNDQSENLFSNNKEIIPSWIKNNAEWWVNEQIGDHAFVSSIQYLINQNIIKIPEIQETHSQKFREMPVWVKNIASYWVAGNISDDEFIRSIQYLVESKIIVIH
jgi:hypothetical protein